MKRLAAFHAFIYSLCFGLVGLQIALLQINEPAMVRISVVEPMVPEARSGIDQAERAFFEGVASYQMAVTQARAGSRSPQITSRLDHARQCLETAIRYRLPLRELAEAYYFLGDSHLHGNKDPVEAERYLLRALDLSPSHYRAACALARSYDLMGLPIQESAAWERALASHPEDADAHRSAALAYYRSTLDDRLERAYDHAIAAIQLNAGFKGDLAPVFEAAEGRSGCELSMEGDPAAGETKDELTGDGESLDEIIDRGSNGRLPDAEAERYAEEIGRLMGESK